MKGYEAERLLRQGIADLEAYVPGRTIEEVSQEYGLDEVIKLASNENALGPSPAALEAIRRALDGLHRYPDGAGRELRGRLAGKLGVDPGRIFLGNGGDDVLSVLARTFLNEGEEAVIPRPTFSPYAQVVRVMGGRVVWSPLRDFRIDLADVLSKVTPRTKLLFLCSPNNPTGAIIPKADLAGFLEELPGSVVVLLDEAYGDFVEDPEWPDSLSLAGGRPLIVLRSFSKIYGLAGLRIGYGVGPEDLIAYMDRTREPFNVNLLAQVAAAAALGDEAYRARVIENVRRGRRTLYAAFEGMGLDCLESQANFIFVRVGEVEGEGKGEAVTEALGRLGVIVRSGAAFGCPEWVRVTVGAPEEIEKLIGALEKSLG